MAVTIFLWQALYYVINFKTSDAKLVDFPLKLADSILL